jgi:hypothetical protein
MQAITATKDIGSDQLFQLEDGTIIRTRIERKTTDAQISEASVEQLNFKFRCAVAVDDTGDVVENAQGDHTIFDAEVHSITLEALANGDSSIEAWVADKLEAIVSKAQRKAVVLKKIAGMFPATE